MTKSKYPSDKQDKFMLRLPDGMREQIKKAADESGRSMNSEIIYRLDESFAIEQMELNPEDDVVIDNTFATDKEILEILVKSNRLMAATLDSLMDRVNSKGIAKISINSGEVKNYSNSEE
jgi:hypothetical protein